MEPEMSSGESSSGAVVAIPEETNAPRVVSSGFTLAAVAAPRGGSNKTAGTVHRNVVTALPDDMDLRDLS